MSLIYIILFIIGCFLFAFFERFYKIPFAKWIFIIPFCLVIANRSLDVPDTESYMNYLLSEDASLSNYDDFGFEVGFQTYTKILKNIIDDNYTLYFALITLTNLLIIDFALTRISEIFSQEQDELITKDEDSDTKYTYSILPLTLYVAFFGLYFNSIVLRVGISLSLLVLTSSFAIKPQKNIFDYLIIISLLFLGYFFHATAVLGLIIVLIIMYSKQLSIRIYLWICSIIALFYFSNLTSRLGDSVFGFMSSLNSFSALSTKLGNYGGESMFNAEGISMKFVFFWLMSFVLIYNDFSSKIYYKYLHVYLTGLALFALFRSVLLVERVTDYFLLFSFVLYYLYLVQQKNFKFWLYYVVIILFQVVFVLRITNREIV